MTCDTVKHGTMFIPPCPLEAAALVGGLSFRPLPHGRKRRSRDAIRAQTPNTVAAGHRQRQYVQPDDLRHRLSSPDPVLPGVLVA
jgi:hypothetical protein